MTKENLSEGWKGDGREGHNERGERAKKNTVIEGKVQIKIRIKGKKGRNEAIL